MADWVNYPVPTDCRFNWRRERQPVVAPAENPEPAANPVPPPPLSRLDRTRLALIDAMRPHPPVDDPSEPAPAQDAPANLTA